METTFRYVLGRVKEFLKHNGLKLTFFNKNDSYVGFLGVISTLNKILYVVVNWP